MPTSVQIQRSPSSGRISAPRFAGGCETTYSAFQSRGTRACGTRRWRSRRRCARRTPSGRSKPRARSCCGICEPRPLASITRSAFSRCSSCAIVAAMHAHAADAVPVVDHALDRPAVQHLHVRQAPHALGDRPFDQRPARGDEIQRAVVAALPDAEVKPLHVAAHVDRRGTGGEQLLAHVIGTAGRSCPGRATAGRARGVPAGRRGAARASRTGSSRSMTVTVVK